MELYENLLKTFVKIYDIEHPLRTADSHDEKCGCLRCVADAAKAFLRNQENDQRVSPDTK